MRWEGRRQSDNIEDRRGMRVSRGGLVGGGLGTLAIALIVMFLGGDPTPILQNAANGPVTTTQEPYVPTPEEEKTREFVSTMLATTEDLWATEFAAMGGQYQAPRLVLFREAVETGCGVADSGVGSCLVPRDDQRADVSVGNRARVAPGFGNAAPVRGARHEIHRRLAAEALGQLHGPRLMLVGLGQGLLESIGGQCPQRQLAADETLRLGQRHQLDRRAEGQARGAPLRQQDDPMPLGETEWQTPQWRFSE